MGSEISWEAFLEIVEGKTIFLGELHFYASHHRFARQLADDLGIDKIGVEMVPACYDQKPKKDRKEYLTVLDLQPIVFAESDYLSLGVDNVVGLRTCPEYDPDLKIVENYKKCVEFWKANDERYSNMLAKQIKKKRTKLNLLGNIRIFEVEKFMDNVITIPQIISSDDKIENLYVENSVTYSSIL